MLSLSFIVPVMVLLPSFVSATAINGPSRSELKNYYTRSHSLGNDYKFDSREWHSVNVSNLDYKYDQPLQERDKKAAGTENTGSKNMGGTISHLINDIWNGLKGLGKSETVKITWYTGHDLLNPSCWANSEWAPTDHSFACALTLEGWESQPKCFKFLELCNGPQKCVFVRVVDSCAGCAPGSKHVDLTRGAFSQLAEVDKGVLNVQMRQASEPNTWYEELWGPRH